MQHRVLNNTNNSFQKNAMITNESMLDDVFSTGKTRIGKENSFELWEKSRSLRFLKQEIKENEENGIGMNKKNREK